MPTSRAATDQQPTAAGQNTAGQTTAGQTTSRQPSTQRPRDAEATKARLLVAALKRFADDGYTATTVRKIAADVGVNVALIHRYFGSKEQLFEACIQRVAKGLRRDSEPPPSLSTLAGRILDEVLGLDLDLQRQVLILLHSSGDVGEDQIRYEALLEYSQRLAALVNSRSEASDETLDGEHNTDTEQLLKAQLLLATALGMTLLRNSVTLEPLASAGAEELRQPVNDLVAALFKSNSTP